MFQLAKHGAVVGLLWFSPYFILCANNKANLAFKTTIIEDTHLTLAGILSKEEANNSLIFLPLQTYEKKFAEFPFLLVYNFLSIHIIIIGSIYNIHLILLKITILVLIHTVDTVGIIQLTHCSVNSLCRVRCKLNDPTTSKQFSSAIEKRHVTYFGKYLLLCIILVEFWLG